MQLYPLKMLTKALTRLRRLTIDCSRLLLFWKPDFLWLYKNRYLRMDANVATNDKKRRLFHKDRYLFARDYLKNSGRDGIRILDAACGTGYGSDILKQAGAQIVGIDICPKTIEFAGKKYGSEKCRFMVSDVLTMGRLADFSFDAAVSFETIEHIDNPLAFLSNLYRVLKKDGVLIISTPNDWGETIYHKFNYNYQLFRQHLEKFFAIEEIYTQNSGSMDLWVNRSAPRRIIKTSEENKSQAECFIAVCRKA